MRKKPRSSERRRSAQYLPADSSIFTEPRYAADTRSYRTGPIMSRLAVLHTVSALAERFKAMLHEKIPNVDTFHMVDESLLQDLMRHGPKPEITRRVVNFAG